MNHAIQNLGSTPLTPSSLRKLLGVDVFNAIPRSVVLWLYQYKFPLSQQYIVERIISKAIQRPANRKKLRVLFSYNSLSKEVNGCDRKTVIAVVSKLKILGILKAVRDSCYGTVYDVNISESQTKENITYRRQTKIASPAAASSAQNPTENNQHSSSETQPPKRQAYNNQQNLQKIETSILKNQSQLETIKEEHQKVLDRYSEISANRFGQKFDIRKKESPEALELCDKAIELSDNIKAIEANIESLQAEKEKLEQTPISQTSSEQQNPEPKVNTTNQKTRFVRTEDVKALKTRLDELKINGHQLTPQMRDQVLNEIVWAIRFGYLSQKDGSTFYLVNYALLLVKDNVWRTPIGFEMNQIVRFTNWALNKQIKAA